MLNILLRKLSDLKAYLKNENRVEQWEKVKNLYIIVEEFTLVILFF